MSPVPRVEEGKAVPARRPNSTNNEIMAIGSILLEKDSKKKVLYK